jgi:signal transduction histidine kinase
MLVESGGRILEANRAYRTLAAEVGSVQEFIDDEAARAEVAGAMAAGEGFGPNEIKVRRTDGKEAWALLSAAPIVLPDGGRAYQFQAVDVTERKTLMDQLIHAQRLSALGRFAGGVAHDFNNVLTAVMGYARLLRSDFEAEGRGLEELDGIDQAAKRAAALSRQLLMFSRRDESKATGFRLSDLARENERILKRIVGDGFSIVVRASDVDDAVVADKGRLEHAVVNLVANARDAMPNGGRIVVATGALRTQEEIPGAVEPVPAGDWAYIEVQDEGTGITEDARTMIFQPFFTTKPADRGTGLGLSTVVGIVRQAGGRVMMDSALGKGTTMRLLFPRVSGALAAAHRVAEAESARRPAGAFVHSLGKTVLVVESDDSVLTIIEELLDRAGYRVVTASHPGEALLVLEKMASLPDVVVVNEKMPLMSGAELVDRFRARGSGLPALFLLNAEAGDGESAAEGKARETGRAPREARLRKPFGEEELIGAVAALLSPRG